MTMPNDTVFLIAFIGLTIACLINLVVISIQIRQLRKRTALQPMKYLLLASVVGYVVAALPLMFVYADILWFHLLATWIIPVAVLANAFGKDIGSGTFYLIYRFWLDK